LQLNPVVAADTLIEIDTVVHFSSLVAQNDKTSDNIELWQLNRTHTLPVRRNVVSRRCIIVLFGTSLSENAMSNASGRAAKAFDANSRERTHILPVNTVYSLLRNWRQQRLNNKGDPD
jgi:hypothetical protein